jgi:hypothetical protein
MERWLAVDQHVSAILDLRCDESIERAQSIIRLIIRDYLLFSPTSQIVCRISKAFDVSFTRRQGRDQFPEHCLRKVRATWRSREIFRSFRNPGRHLLMSSRWLAEGR